MLIREDPVVLREAKREIQELIDQDLLLNVRTTFRHADNLGKLSRENNVNNNMMMRVWSEIGNRPPKLPAKDRRENYSNTFWRNFSEELDQTKFKRKADYIVEPTFGRLSEEKVDKVRLLAPEISADPLGLCVKIHSNPLAMKTKKKEEQQELVAHLYPVQIPPYSRLGNCTFSQYLSESRLLQDQGSSLRRALAKKYRALEQQKCQLKWLSDVRNPPINPNGYILPPDSYKKYKPHFDASKNRAEYEAFVKGAVNVKNLEPDLFGKLVEKNPLYPRLWKLTTNENVLDTQLS
ncbi:hypothetical protein Ciccas_002802 [Cichlidogyrus casuarinus]|uniref:Uncharacterized protein n=1 Tax=Cichlidogyrus casuarinus TaxID=1844966 RepID=A0ABD2QG66_9PLAT